MDVAGAERPDERGPPRTLPPVERQAVGPPGMRPVPGLPFARCIPVEDGERPRALRALDRRARGGAVRRRARRGGRGED
jgi:hypothetical protein